MAPEIKDDAIDRRDCCRRASSGALVTTGGDGRRGHCRWAPELEVLADLPFGGSSRSARNPGVAVRVEPRTRHPRSQLAVPATGRRDGDAQIERRARGTGGDGWAELHARGVSVAKKIERDARGNGDAGQIERPLRSGL